MSEAVATTVGPVLRMCGNPGCGGEMACDRIPDPPAMGYAGTWDLSIKGYTEEQADAKMCAGLAEALAVASISTGTGRRFIPDGCEFTVHKGDRGLPEPGRRPGSVHYAAIYSGGTPRAEVLAGAPVFDKDKAKARANLMRQAGGSGRPGTTDACWP